MEKLNSTKFYQLMGKFCVQFEMICAEMEDCAATVLEENGLKNRALQKIILANLTADPLQRML